jgi:hypothetical protein
VAFDLISSEYGWSDKKIFKLSLARFRQITAAIQVRRFHARREENTRASWVARNIASYVAAGFETPKGKTNEALNQAQKLAIDDIDVVLLGGTLNTGVATQKENGVGSYERLMRGMGGGLHK